MAARDGGAESPAAGVPGELLIEAGLLLAAELSLPVLLRRLVELATQITGARYGALGVAGPGGRIVEFITVGVSDEQRAAIGPIPSGRGILGALIHDPQPLRLRRLQDDPRSVGFPPHHPPMTSFLGAPVRARGRIFGNLYLTEKVGGAAFTAADEAAVVTLATQAGVAIANSQIYRDLRQREQWLAALQAVTAALLTGQDASSLMATIVKRARELAGADLAAIALREGDDRRLLRVVAADGKGAQRLIRSAPRRSGTVSHLVLDTGNSQAFRGDARDLSGSLVAAAGIAVGALIVVPLVVGGEVRGTISLTLTNATAEFEPEALSLLESFANQAALALDYSRTQARSLELAVVEERHRIARDLHDEPVQALIHLGRQLELIAEEPPGALASARHLAETRDLAKAIVDGLRQLTEGLRSEVLEREGLDAALRELAQRFSDRSGVAVSCSLSPNRERADPALERDLLRLAQEALSNVERHSGARRARVGLARDAEGLTLTVADDGVGFEPQGEGAVRPGLGSLGMRERSATHGGALTISSRPGRGTLVRARVPHPKARQSPSPD